MRRKFPGLKYTAEAMDSVLSYCLVGERSVSLRRCFREERWRYQKWECWDE